MLFVRLNNRSPGLKPVRSNRDESISANLRRSQTDADRPSGSSSARWVPTGLLTEPSKAPYWLISRGHRTAHVDSVDMRPRCECSSGRILDRGMPRLHDSRRRGSRMTSCSESCGCLMGIQSVARRTCSASGGSSNSNSARSAQLKWGDTRHRRFGDAILERVQTARQILDEVRV